MPAAYCVTVDNSQRDVLDRIGKFIACKQMLLFGILLLCGCHFTYYTSSASRISCGEGALEVCRIFTVLLLVIIAAMFILTFILALGISMRQAEYLCPWLSISIVMVVVSAATLTMITDILHITVGSLVLFFQIMSWYPIYKLYHRYCAESKVRDQQRLSRTIEDNCLLNTLAVVPNVSSAYAASNYTESKGPSRGAFSDDPPSYNEAMGIEPNPPIFADIQCWFGAAL